MIEEISIVLPALNEEESLPSLVENIEKEIEELNIDFEIIIIDDGSKKLVKNFIEDNEKINILRNKHTMGQSYSLLKGFKNAKYKYICTLDSDGQNPPDQIPILIKCFNDDFQNLDVVAGFRLKRKDSFLRSIYSKIANQLIRMMTSSKSKDLGCSLKIFKSEMVDDIKYNGDIHRILIAIFEYRNYRLKQIPVNHLERKFGETKYGIGRFIPVVIDSILLYLTEGFTKSSRYALGKLSVFFGFISIGFFGVAIYQKLSLSIFIHKNPIVFTKFRNEAPFSYLLKILRR